MSTVSSPTVSVTLAGIGPVNLTKSTVDKNFIERTSSDGAHSLQHVHQTTSKGRRRMTARLYVTDPNAEGVTASATVIVDLPKGENAWGEVAIKALVDFLAANTHEEAALLVAGHNYG